MSEIVVLSGHPRPRSRTSELAVGLGQAIAGRLGDATPTIVEAGELGAGLLTNGHQPTDAALAAVQDADLLVVATPARNGTFTGILKVLFDRLPANALAGTYAVPVVTAELQPRAELAEAALRRLLRELGADVADFGLTAVDTELADIRTLAERYVTALRLTYVPDVSTCR
jgi:FMN reductase